MVCSNKSMHRCTPLYRDTCVFSGIWYSYEPGDRISLLILWRYFLYLPTRYGNYNFSGLVLFHNTDCRVIFLFIWNVCWQIHGFYVDSHRCIQRNLINLIVSIMMKTGRFLMIPPPSHGGDYRSDHGPPRPTTWALSFVKTIDVSILIVDIGPRSFSYLL